MESPSASLFHDWIQPEFSWIDGLMSNPHPSLSSWLLSNAEAVMEQLSNPSSTRLKIILSMNPTAVPFLLQYPSIAATGCAILSNSNPWALHWIHPILEQMEDSSSDVHPNRESVLYALSRNENPLVVEWLMEHIPLEHQEWYCLSSNPAAIDFLLEHPERIVWKTFTSNPHPRAIQHMAEHPEKMATDPYSHTLVMMRNKCPDAGAYLKSIGREDMYCAWTYRYGSLDEMDLEHLASSSMNDMAENPKAISYFKDRPHLIQAFSYHLASNPAIFL